MSSRITNEPLRLLLRQSGWTGAQLALAVNRVAAEVGVAARYDRTSVAHWLAGARPRAPIPDVLAETFSRRLGTRLSAADLGWGEKVEHRAASVPDRVADTRRTECNTAAGLLSIPPGVQYRLAANPVSNWPVSGRCNAESRATSPLSPSRAQVVAAEDMLRVFIGLDDAFGGGYARTALAGYLAASISPLLCARMSPSLRRRMFTVATHLAHLSGLMCFDSNLHGLAQRYYLLATDLAAETGSRLDYAITLCAMSAQAAALGHHRHALHFAEAAAQAGGRADPMRQAFLHGQLAVARAARRQRADAVASLAAAERCLAQSTSRTRTCIGAYHEAALAGQRAQVRTLLGDRRGAIDALSTSVRIRPAQERRSQAAALAKLAELQLADGAIEHAAATGNQFLDLYPGLHSARVYAAFCRLRALLQPYRHNGAAAALLRRAAETHWSPPTC